MAGAYAWYEVQGVGLGEEFLAEVDALFRVIEQFPEMYGFAHGDVRRAIVSRFPYAVFYLVEARQVVVLTVLHSARDPKLWPRSASKSW